MSKDIIKKHYEEIGSKGGKSTYSKIGKKGMSALGKKSGKARRKLAKQKAKKR